MYHYALRFEQTEAGIAVFCRDLPELTSYGKDIEHALREALDAIEATLSIYVDQRRAIPHASAARAGERVIYLPAASVAKIELWNAMQAQGMRKASLCRLLEISPLQGHRLVDFLHPSKISTLEQALGKLGRRLMIYAETA